MTTNGEESPIEAKNAIEIGWIVALPIDEADRQAIDLARMTLGAQLSQTFPEFDWHLSSRVHEVELELPRTSIVHLLDVCSNELERMGWDFALLLTDRDLATHYGPQCFAAPSSALSSAVLSTYRVDPQIHGETITEEQRAELMSGRVVALGAHLMGEIIGLEHSVDPANFMFAPQSAHDLDRMTKFSPAAIEDLRERLVKIGDTRLEEKRRSSRWSTWGFYRRALWHDRAVVRKAVVQAQPWQFPFRLTKLLAAAFSTLLLLTISAEAWDLGMRQPPWLVAVSSVAAVLFVTRFLLLRQGLARSYAGAAPRELGVVARAAVAISLTLGMLTTYAVLFVSSLVIASVFFDPQLISVWASSIEEPITFRHYAVFAGFVAALGILLSALGATFEEQAYFRHVALVDEET